MSSALTQARIRARRLAARVRRVRSRPIGVHARLHALELEVQENRQLNRRIAELTDVVTDLLVPLAAGQNHSADEVLRAYRRSLGG